MAQLPLNFPVFYQCAIEGHTSLFKYDAVSILLLGVPKAQDTKNILSRSDVSNYISGKQRMKDVVLTRLLGVSAEEAERRIQLLGIQDTGTVAYSLKRLVAAADLGPGIQTNLTDAFRNGFAPFIAEVFLTAIKYPPKSVRPLTQEEKDVIASCCASVNDLEMESPQPTPPITLEPKRVVPSPSKEELNILSQEEIERLLGGLVTDNSKEELEPDIVCNPLNTLYISPIRRGGINEATNMLLSNGVTAFANILDVEVRAGLPHFDFYEDQKAINRLLLGEKRFTVLYEFTPVEVSSTGSIRGYIALALEHRFFSDYWEQHTVEHPMQFQTTRERGEYKGSVSDEFCSQFTGAAVTALADLISQAYTIEASDILSFGKNFGMNSPMFAGTLPFHYASYHFEAHLLLDWQSAHVLMDIMEHFVES